MKKPFPALCLDCKHSKPEDRSHWVNECTHPKVIASDAYALANSSYADGGPRGVSCSQQRDKVSLFASCGRKGKLWEPRD